MRTKIQRLLLLAILTVGASACSNLVIHKGDLSTEPPSAKHWHHDGIIGLVEFSEPNDLKQICEGQNWQQVQVHNSFLQGAIKALSLTMYDPWTVAVKCAGDDGAKKNETQ